MERAIIERLSSIEGNTMKNLIEWAEEQASTLLSPLGNRWLHVQGVAEKARSVSKAFSENDGTYLIAAAYLHDIGYAPSLKKTGFHPLDGAYYLRSHRKNRLACLVAHHSEAQFEAHLRELLSELDIFPRQCSSISDALTYCDITTSSTGREITFQERILDIFSHYGDADIVSQAIHQAVPSLSLAVERTQKKLDKYNSVQHP